jgi:GTP-dependent phosphoenolpyruvate carboxykinase
MQKSRVAEWVHLCENWCEPDWTHWCDGSPRDLARLMKLMRNAPILPDSPGAANCVTPADAMTQIALECRGSLRGRIMFIVPYLLPGDEAGVLVTDSAARAAQFCRMACVGTEALAVIADGREFTAQLHLSRNENAARGETSIRCHLSGPAVAEKAVCQTAPRARISLPMNEKAPSSAPSDPTGKSRCLSCQRLCPNRARAISAAEARGA